jgi:hypothetical protein
LPVGARQTEEQAAGTTGLVDETPAIHTMGAKSESTKFSFANKAYGKILAHAAKFPWADVNGEYNTVLLQLLVSSHIVGKVARLLESVTRATGAVAVESPRWCF